MMDDVTVTVDVNVDPVTAFDVFWREIDRWWRRGPINWYDARRAIATWIEPGVGGRWVEAYDEEGSDVFVIARVTEWEPGRGFVLTMTDGDVTSTEVAVSFDEVAAGTRVTVTHRGWAEVDERRRDERRRAKRGGWANIVGWYVDWCAWGSPQRVREV